MNKKRKRDNYKRRNKSKEEELEHKQNFENPMNELKVCLKLSIAKINSDKKKKNKNLEDNSISNVSKESTFQNSINNEVNNYSSLVNNNNDESILANNFMINNIFSNEREEEEALFFTLFNLNQ